MKNSFMLMATIFLLASCAKEEFIGNKGNNTGSVSPVITTTTQLCSQRTLISPKVDILMLWDNSTSFNFVTPQTKAAMGELITSVSEKFDYHVLSLPLNPVSSAPLSEGVLVVKDATSVSSNALGILRTKEQAVANLNFNPGGSNERGIDRALSVLENNRSNGIFRDGAYTIVVVISNEDDKGCAEDNGFSEQCDNTYDINNYLAPKIKKMICLRGNSSYSASDCSAVGVTQPINSSMLRFINISPQTQCALGLYKTNQVYKKFSKTLYQTPYTSGATPNDDLSANPDSQDLCVLNNNPSTAFTGVYAAIQQTLIKHVYDYWPVTGPSETFDPDTIRVVRSDGKILLNRALDPSATNGFELLVDSSGKPANQVNQNTRSYPTPGEPFSGKMIKLFGINGNDKIVYPDCLTVTYDGVKLKYGYVYVSNTAPAESSIELRINGVLVPKSTTNGWDYMALQSTSGLDPSLKVALLPPGATSGYILRLNGSAQFLNTGSAINVQVFHNSAGQ